MPECEAAGNTSNVNVDMQLPGKSARGDSFPNVPPPYIPLAEAGADDSVAEELTSPPIAEEVMVIAFG